ncbi:hypothetical protein [Streptomyces sp. NPDC005009]
MSLFPSCLDLLELPTACLGCGAHAPAWTRIAVDGLRVLTHDGDLICPEDRHFSTRPAPVVPAPVLEVAA